MISFRNAKKIFSDEDVRLNKRKDSVHLPKKMLNESLDPTYSNNDIAQIAHEGAASLEGHEPDGVTESLVLLGEVLGFHRAPKLFQSSPIEIRGDVGKETMGAVRFGPSLPCDPTQDTLINISGQLKQPG